MELAAHKATANGAAALSKTKLTKAAIQEAAVGNTLLSVSTRTTPIREARLLS